MFQIGDVNSHRFGHFTSGAKRQVLSKILPKTPKIQAEFDAKVFCGSHSKNGDIFMSACQDQKIRLFDTTSGDLTLKRTIQARNVGWSVLDTALSPDTCHLIYSSWCDSSKFNSSMH